MDVTKLHDAIDFVKNSLRGGLIATDIFTTNDGQSLAGYNSQPAASALFARMTTELNGSLTDAGFPTLGKYYLLDLVDGNKVVIVPMDKYIWGLLVNKDAQIGLITNVLLPKMIDSFEEAITG
jgi:hypothetical protein